MTKEITKAIILQEMQDKLKLREFDPATFLFDETVVPIYNIAPHLETFENIFVEKNVTTAGGLYFLSVPSTQKWTLYRYDVVFMGAGAYTVAGVYSTRDVNTPTEFCYLDLTAGQSVSYHVGLPHPVVLGPRSQLHINIDGYTSPQNLRLYIDYTKETIR